MTDEYSSAINSSSSVVLDFSAEAAHGLIALADRLALLLAEAGAPTCIEIKDNWARLTVLADEGQVDIAIMEPEVPGLGVEALPMRFGLAMSFGVPSGEAVLEKPDTFFYVPADFTVDQLFSLSRGHLSPAQFTDLLNFSVRHSMSVPREKFPSAILLMIRDRTELHYAGEHKFELWTQSRGGIKLTELKPTSNPHEAAAQALEIGFAPTIYRCQSGNFIAFKTTSGGVYL